MLRKIVFYIFIIVYLVLCPLIILDSLGVVIRPKEKKLMMSTGLISIDTIPPGASLYLNGKLFPKKSPAIIRDLAPGSYSVKAELPGYRSWEKEITVETEQATALRSILLIPDKWKVQTIVHKSFIGLTLIEGSPLILLTDRHTGALTVFKWDIGLLDRLALSEDLKSEDWRLSDVFPNSTNFNKMKLIKVITMPQSNYILVFAEVDGKTSSFWIEADDQNKPPRDITALLPFIPDQVRWDRRDPENLFFIVEKKLNRIDVEEEKIFPDLALNIKGFNLFNKKVYWIDSEDGFWESDVSLKNARSLIGHLNKIPKEFQGALEYQIHALSENDFILKDENGRLLTNKLPFQLVEQSVVDFDDHLNDNRLLFWTKNALGIIDFNQTGKEGIFETGPQITWLIQNAENIHQAFWVNKGSHVLFRDDDQVKITDVTSVGKTEMSTLIKTEYPVSYSDALGKLFYLDETTQYLNALTVLPAHKYVTFQLPETFRKKDLR